MKKILFLVLFLIISGLSFSQSEIPVLDKSKRVFDFENIFVNDENLQNILYQTENQTNCKIVLISTSNFFNKSSASEANLELGRLNYIGNGYNGIIILISKNKRRTEISVERRLEGVLPDIQLTRISKIGNSYFKLGNFDEGFLKILESLNEKLQPKEVQQEIKQNQQIIESQPINLSWLYDALFVLMASLLGFFGWNYKIKKDKEKQDEIDRMERQKKQEQKDKLYKIEREKQIQKQNEEWSKYKFDNEFKYSYFEELFKNVETLIRRDFKIPLNYFDLYKSQKEDFKNYILNGNFYNIQSCEIIKKSFDDLSYQDLSIKLKKLEEQNKQKIEDLKNAYNKAKLEIDKGVSGYNLTILRNVEFNKIINNKYDLIEESQLINILNETYLKVINWESLKIVEERRIEKERIASIKREEDQKRRDELDRIARKKREDEEDSRRLSYSSSSSWSSSDSSSSFGSSSGGDFGGGGGGSDW